MSLGDSAKRLKKEYLELWPEGLTPRQIWFLVKLSKGTRLYCRSNTAFNNFFNAIFGDEYNFEQVTKQKPGGDTYMGLKITSLKGEGEIENDLEGE